MTKKKITRAGKILLPALFFMINLSVIAQMWQGRLGTSRVVFTMKGDSTVFIQSPEAGINNLRAKVQAVNKDSLVFDGSYWGKFAGVFSSDRKSLYGVWQTATEKRKLEWVAVDTLQPLQLPQTPRPPFPYTSEEVQFTGSNGICFGGTLTIPHGGKKPFTAVVLVSGTGPQDRNGTMAGHRWFEVIADSLSRAGFAVLRTDDRGVGGTSGVYETATTADFAQDALEAFKYLQTRKEINPKKIGLLGHSEGGAAVNIAVANNPSVAFVVLLSGLATKGIDALKNQNETIINQSPMSDEDKQRNLSLLNHLFDTVYRYANDSNLEQRIRQTYQLWKQQDDTAMRQKHGADFTDHFRFFQESYIRQATGPWYRYHIRFNPQEFLPNIKVPMLAIYGDKDVMVPAMPNVDTIKKLTTTKRLTTYVIPGLNHLLQHCISCSANEYNRLDETIASEVLSKLVDWIRVVN